MAGDTGLFSEGKHPRVLESESKRHVMVTAQKPPLGDVGRPITDATFNAQGKIMFNMIRRLAQHGVGNGPTSQSLFKIEGDSGTDNKINVTTAASTDYDKMPVFLVGGLQAILPAASGSIALDTTAANSQWLHMQTDASAVGAQTVFTCSNALWPNLGARTVRMLQNNGSWATKTLASNTNSTFTISVAITVGAGAAEVPPNAYFYFEPTTPVGARDDGVWLDVFLQEVGGVAPLYGTTAAAYMDSTIDDVIGTTSSYETARRFRTKQSIFVAQADDDVGAGFIDGGGTAISNGTVWWVDAAGISHISVLLATLARTTDGNIMPFMVGDTRLSVGEAAREDATTLLWDLAQGAWIGTLPTITRNVNTLEVTIGAGETLCFYGSNYVLRSVPQRVFTTRSDGTAWGNSTNHYIYADTSTGQYVCETSLGGDSAPVIHFLTTAGGVLPAFTEGVNYTDMRRAVLLSDRFKFDVNGFCRENVDFGIYDQSTDRSAALRFRSAAGAQTGLVYVQSGIMYVISGNSAVGTTVGSTTNGVHFGSDTGSAADTISVFTETTGGIVEAYEPDVYVSGKLPPGSWRMKEVHSTELRAPHVRFGDSALDPAPIVGTIWVPAAEGYLTTNRTPGVTFTAGGGTAIVDSSVFIRKDFDRVVFDMNLVDVVTTVMGRTAGTTLSDMSSYFLGKLFPNATGVFTQSPQVTVPLRVPRGTYLTSVKLHLLTTFPNTSDLTLEPRVVKRNGAGSAQPAVIVCTNSLAAITPVTSTIGSAASYTFNNATAAGPVQLFEWTFTLSTPLFVNDERRLYMEVYGQNTGTSMEFTTGGGDALWIVGVESAVSIRGIGTKPGSPDVNNYISYPFEGL